LIIALIDTGDLAAAESACAAALARCQDTGDVQYLSGLLMGMADLDVQAGRFQDATTHLREGLQIALRAGHSWDVGDGLGSCALLCAATGRYAAPSRCGPPRTSTWGSCGPVAGRPQTCAGRRKR
jgi:hypothetical protein